VLPTGGWVQRHSQGPSAWKRWKALLATPFSPPAPLWPDLARATDWWGKRLEQPRLAALGTGAPGLQVPPASPSASAPQKRCFAGLERGARQAGRHSEAPFKYGKLGSPELVCRP